MILARLFVNIQRPEFFWRPNQVWRRLRRDSILARNDVRLAWGLPIEVFPTSFIGIDIRNVGVHDRTVAEAICRLLDAGEQAVDVGAHIGQNVSLMAIVAGPHGNTSAFEPAPEAWSLLNRNVASWAAYEMAPITLVHKGASSRVGTAWLHEASDIGGHSLEDDTDAAVRQVAYTSRGVEIELTTLDESLPDGEVGLLKIDVEGHELAVLEGAARLLSGKRIRDIVFEDFQPQPSPATLLLESSGYHVFYLYPAWRRPKLVPVRESQRWIERATFEPNFLATCAPVRAKDRFRTGTWKCLRIRANLK